MNQSTEICNRLYLLAKEQNAQNTWLELNGVPVLVIQNHDDADWILRRNVQNYHKHMAWFRQVLGASRFSENGEAWKIRKELSQIYFNRFDREQTYKLACSYAKRTLKTLVAASEHSSRINDDTLRAMTFSVLVENFFNIPLEATGIDTQNLADLMEYASEYAFVPADKTTSMYRDKLRLLPALRRQVLADFKLFRSDKVLPNPMLEGMLAADNDPHNDIVLEHELLTFFAAGAETTASAVGWACYLLAIHPQLQDSLRNEVQALLDKGQNDWAHLSELPQLTAFISETLRLYPPTPIIARLSINKDTIGVDTIGPNQNILISFIGIQHDQRLYKNPWQLNMDEAVTSSTRKGSGIYSAFSTGPRVCGGKHFALVELTGFLTIFLTQGKFTLTSTQAPVFYWKSQMLNKGGQPVNVTFYTD